MAFPALARRFPELQLAGAPTFRERSIVFGVVSLPVHLGRDALAPSSCGQFAAPLS